MLLIKAFFFSGHFSKLTCLSSLPALGLLIITLSYSPEESYDFDCFPPNSLPQLVSLTLKTNNQIVCSTFAAACPNLTNFEFSTFSQIGISVSNYLTPFIQMCPNLEELKINAKTTIPGEADSILFKVRNQLTKIKYLGWTQKGLSRVMTKEILLKTPTLCWVLSENVLFMRKNTSAEEISSAFQDLGPRLLSKIQIV